MIDFFELDSDMSVIAAAFDYLRNSRAKLTFTYQDARIALSRTPRGIYDILIIDAFSGDSVPIHLLTTDAIREYREHIKDQGMILFHISNRYLDLAPVLKSNARIVDAYALSDSNESENSELLASEWVALTWDGKINAAIADLWEQDPAQPATVMVRPWTDGYSHVLSVLKPEVFLDSIKSFTPFDW